jgi:hypothetical protein
VEFLDLRTIIVSGKASRLGTSGWGFRLGTGGSLHYCCAFFLSFSLSLSLSLSVFLCVPLSHSSSSLSLSVFLFLVLFGCVLTRALHTHSRHALVAFSTSLCLLRLNQLSFCCSSRASKLSASGRRRDCYTTNFTNGRQNFRGLQVRITHARTHSRHSLTHCSLQACTVVYTLTVLTGVQ